MSERLPKDKYVIKLEISTDKLHGLPPNSGPATLVYGMLVTMMCNRGDQLGGYAYEDQKMLYRVRTAIERVVKTQETSVILDSEEFAFLDAGKREGRVEPKSNEAAIRVYKVIEDAIAEHDARAG